MAATVTSALSVVGLEGQWMYLIRFSSHSAGQTSKLRSSEASGLSGVTSMWHQNPDRLSLGHAHFPVCLRPGARQRSHRGFHAASTALRIGRTPGVSPVRHVHFGISPVTPCANSLFQLAPLGNNNYTNNHSPRPFMCQALCQFYIKSLLIS